MNSDHSFELFGPLASSIRDLLVREWSPSGSKHEFASPEVYDNYIPAIYRLAKDRHSSEEHDIEHIAAYLNFVVKNYIGEIPDKDLNHTIAAKIFALAEAARQRRPQFA